MNDIMAAMLIFLRKTENSRARIFGVEVSKLWMSVLETSDGGQTDYFVSAVEFFGSKYCGEKCFVFDL